MSTGQWYSEISRDTLIFLAWYTCRTVVHINNQPTNPRPPHSLRNTQRMRFFCWKNWFFGPKFEIPGKQILHLQNQIAECSWVRLYIHTQQALATARMSAETVPCLTPCTKVPDNKYLVKCFCMHMRSSILVTLSRSSIPTDFLGVPLLVDTPELADWSELQRCNMQGVCTFLLPLALTHVHAETLMYQPSNCVVLIWGLDISQQHF